MTTDMLKSVLVMVLVVYLVVGSFITPVVAIRRNTSSVLLLLFVAVCLSLYINEPMVGVLLTSCAITYLYSIDSKESQKEVVQSVFPKSKGNQILKKKKDELLESMIETSVVAKEEGQEAVLEKTASTLKTQSNVFNKLNFDLFYNELGEQFNIQGFDEDVKGFDSTIYM